MSEFATYLEKDVKSLMAERLDAAREVLSLRLQHKGGQLKNSALLKTARAKKARVETALSYQKLGIQLRAAAQKPAKKASTKTGKPQGKATASKASPKAKPSKATKEGK